jgi:dUTPase
MPQSTAQFPVVVKIVNESGNPLPAYATEGSAGMDLCAHIHESVVLEPLERKAHSYRNIYRTTYWL